MSEIEAREEPKEVVDAHLFWFMGSPSKITSTLFVAVLVTCFGSVLFGYSMAVLNNMQIKIECFLYPAFCFNGVQVNDTNAKKIATSLYGGLTAAYVVLGTFASFGSGFVSDFMGRRNSLIMNNGIAIVGGLLVCLVFAAPHAALIFISRLILGLNAGLTTGIAPTFIAEISPTTIRGAVTACHQLSITIGIVFAYIFTMDVTLNRETYWVVALALPIIPAAIAIIVLPFLPESPRYLYINSNKPELGKQAFMKYNQIQDPDSILNEIKEEDAMQKSLKKFSILDLFMSDRYRKAIIISTLLMVMQQFSGINAIVGYSSNMLSKAGVPADWLQLCVLFVGILNMVSTIPAVILMDIFGRRTILIYPSILACSALVFSFIMVGVVPQISPDSISWSSIVAMVFICLYIVGFALGMGPIPGIIVAEMFTQAPRAAAYSLALGINWFSSFIILLCYPIVDNALPKGYVFIIFFVIAIPCLVYLIIVMPETKNKSFAEIAQNLAGKQVGVEENENNNDNNDII